MIKPSNIALAISGVLIAISVVMLINEITKKTELDNMRIINLLLFLSSAISLHGLLHLGAEVYFGFNPLENGKFIY